MSLEQIAASMKTHYGEVYAQRWLKQQRAHAEAFRAEASRAQSSQIQQAQTHSKLTSLDAQTPQERLEASAGSPLPYPAVPTPVARQERFYPHDSYLKATELLAPYRKALGAAYKTLHLLARWSVEHATENDPAPHLMTCYWTLEEALGQSERNLRRHLVEAGHPWSDSIRHLIDLRHNYGELLDGKDDEGKDKTRPCITSMVIRFFPRGRQSDNARVKRWGRRDLLADSDEGRTRPTRQHLQPSKRRYERSKAQMSGYSSVKEQAEQNNWLLVKLGQTVSQRSEENKDYGSLYADIPKNHVLDALRSDLNLALEETKARGGSVTRTRTHWVDTAAQVLAARHWDDKPLPCHHSDKHVTHHDGFTDLWRRLLWTAIKAELYGGTGWGWRLVRRMVNLTRDAQDLGKAKPTAWAWVQVREEVEALRRDFGSGRAGVLEA